MHGVDYNSVYDTLLLKLSRKHQNDYFVSSWNTTAKAHWQNDSVTELGKAD